MDMPKRAIATSEQVPVADWTVASGCPVCAGELSIRRVPGSARSYCASCHFLGKPQIGRGPFGMQILHPLQVC